MKPIHIFRAGRHTPMKGEAIAFAASDLAATAAAYDPARHEAPIVVGHPATDAPAYGWVGGLVATGDDLVASPRQVDPAFAAMVAEGKFKKISASFWRPDAPNNPHPGVWALRHVGFLGAAAPAVSGLRPIEFAGDAGETVEFSDDNTGWLFGDIADAFRRLRDWMIGAQGQDAADRALPSDMVTNMATEAQRIRDAEMAEAMQDASSGSLGTQYAAPPAKEPPVPPSPPVEPEDIARQRADLAAREAALTEREAAAAAAFAATRRAEIDAFVTGLVTEARLPAASAPLAVAFLAALPADTVVDFAAGDAATQPALDAARALLSSIPPMVPLGKSREGAPPVDFADANALAAEAVAFQDREQAAGRSVSTAEAVAAVMKGNRP